jgi:hypothetical protein
MIGHAMGTSHRVWDWQVPVLADRYRLRRGLDDMVDGRA